MRRVSIYKIAFTYIRANHWGKFPTTVVVGHESMNKAIEFIETHPDYPGAQIEEVKLKEDNILVPEP